MRALLASGGRVALAERPEPAPGPDEALVRVHRAGVCDTDLQILRGYMGFEGVLGHEWVGTVEEGPDGWRGRRVVGEINFACGRCPSCDAGLARHCPTRRVMGIQGADGAFAEQVAVPVANLHAVPDGVSDEAAVFAEPLAAAFEIREQLAELGSFAARGGVEGARAVVLGDGKLGLLVAQVLHAEGARVRAVGHHEGKLALLAARGIATTLERDWEPAAERADLVVEAPGSAAGLAASLRATRPRGTLVLKSTVADRFGVDLAPLVIHEIHLLGSRCGPFPPALDALTRGTVDVADLVTDTLPLSRGADALQHASQPGALKILLDCT